MNRNEIVIIGSDHHNTLAVARCFGKRKVSFKLLIHDKCCKAEDLVISHSKYVNDVYVIDSSEANLLDWLLLNKTQDYKQVLFPCSDLAEFVLDKYYEKLSDFYILPGFINKPGLVCKMMNKYEQKKWAVKNNIMMAKSWDLERNNNCFIIPEDITIPCIIKPTVSAFGNKSDIKICNNTNELYEGINIFNNSNYDRLLIQEFIKKDYEICAVGCITTSNNIYGGVIKKIRENPPNGGGSLTFAKFINDNEINKKVNIVLDKLVEEKYNGMYDIEFFVCKNDIYLNEINFRHSGNGYALIKSGIESPYIWYSDRKDYKLSKNIVKNNTNIYFIDDFNEFSLYRQKYISLMTFIKDFIKAKAHSIIAISDINVFIYKIKKILKNKGSKNEKIK